jgi:uncharacterized membrane protein
MLSNEQTILAQTTNRHSIISLILGIITLILFCGGIFIPIPFTSLVCVPVSALIGIAALIYGLISLNRIKRHNQTGHSMAWTGILIGAFVLLCMLCTIAGILALFHFAPETFQDMPIPSFLRKFQF